MGAEVSHALTFDGAKYYNQNTINNPARIELCIGSGDTDKSGEFFTKIITANNEFAVNKDLGVWGDPEDEDYTPNPFFKDMSGPVGPGNKDKKGWRHNYKKQVNGRWIDGFGTQSTIYHVSYSTNKKGGAEAAAGGRYNIAVKEEVGLMSNVVEAYNSDVATVTTDGDQFGVQALLGTSGNIETIIPSKEMFTNPEDYNIVSYDDIWEHTGKIGFFLPAYLTFTEKFRDANGNIILDKAKEAFEERRMKAANSSNPKTLRVEKMNYPMIPSDMWVSDKGYYLPYEEASEREKQLMSNNLYQKIGTPMEFVWDSNAKTGVKEKPLMNSNPFTDYPIRKDRDNLDGCIMIYERPIDELLNIRTGNDGYIFTHDPYVSDNIDEGGSIACTHVWLNPKYWSKHMISSPLVATYIGKPKTGKKTYYKNLEKLIQYYGNPIRSLAYESNRGSYCKDYFVKKGKTYLLALRPQFTTSDSAVEKIVTNFGYVVSGAGKAGKISLLDDAHDWLLNEIETYSGKKTIIETFPCIFTIREIMAFNLEGNFDAVSSMIIAPLHFREIEYLNIKERAKAVVHKKYNFLINNKLFK